MRKFCKQKLDYDNLLLRASLIQCLNIKKSKNICKKFDIRLEIKLHVQWYPYNRPQLSSNPRYSAKNFPGYWPVIKALTAPITGKNGWMSWQPVIKAASCRGSQLSQLSRQPVIKAASYLGSQLSRKPVIEAASYQGSQLSRQPNSKSWILLLHNCQPVIGVPL